MSIWCAVIIGIAMVISAAILAIGHAFNGAAGVEWLCGEFLKDPDKVLDPYMDSVMKIVHKMEDMDEY